MSTKEGEPTDEQWEWYWRDKNYAEREAQAKAQKLRERADIAKAQGEEKMIPKHAAAPLKDLVVTPPQKLVPGPTCLCGLIGVHTGEQHRKAMEEKQGRDDPASW